MTCSACAFENRALARFCGRCGAPLQALVTCPRCATTVPVDYEYCDACGTRLSLGDVLAARGGRRRGGPLAAAAPGAVAQPRSAPPATPHWSARLSTGQARALVFAGFAAASAGQLYLLFGPQTNRARVVGLICLALGALTFGLGTVRSVLAPELARPRFPPIVPAGLVSGWPSRLAAVVGALAFLTLLGRLWIGSTAGSDLLLWLVAIVALAMPFVGEATPRRPSHATALEAAGVGLLTLAVIVASARDLDDWYYSVIGDEYSFLTAASSVLADGIRRPFAQDGVYGDNPVLGSIAQAAVMRLFGRDHVGWVMTSVLSHAATIPAVYLVGRIVSGRVAGLLAATMVGFSHYLFAFAHLGYFHSMAQAPAALALACFVGHLRHPRPWLLYAAGLAAGLGFYTAYPARMTLAILALCVVLLVGWRAFRATHDLAARLLALWPLGLGFVLGAGPIFAVSRAAVVARTFSELPGLYPAEITGPIPQRILTNLWVNVPAFFQNDHVAHFVSGSLLDPLTATLSALGIGLAVRWRTHAGALVVLVWAAFAVFVAGVLSPFPSTAITRLLFAVPPLAILAALAARQLAQAVPVHAAWPRRRWAVGGIAAALAVAVVWLNLYRFWVTTPRVMPLTQDAAVVGALRTGACDVEPARTVVVLRDAVLVRAALLSFWPDLQEGGLPRFVSHESLRPGEPVPTAGAACVIFGQPNDERARAAIETLRRAHPDAEVRTFRDRARVAAVQVVRLGSGGRP